MRVGEGSGLDGLGDHWHWDFEKLVGENKCVHLDSYPRCKGPLPPEMIAELKKRGWTVHVKETGLEIIPQVRFLCPPGITPKDGITSQG